VEQIWKTKLPAKPGLPASSLFSRRGVAKMRAAWLCRYDPVSTAVFGNAADALRQCELVVAQHLFMTETAKFAHVILPTTAYGEERVTFTNTERRIQLANQVIAQPAGTSPAWEQLVRVAQAMGADWKYDSAADIMDEIGEVVPFYSGANYDNLAREYGRQWPCTKDRPLGTRFLFVESMADHSFKFIPVVRQPQPAVSKEYPLTLVFGHSLYYWHQNVLIKHSEVLKREYRILLLDYPDGFVEMNSDDARNLGIRDAQKIRLRSTTGSVVVTVRVTPEVRSGTVFVPYFVRQVQQQVCGSIENGIQSLPVRAEKETA
jgi:formate dehydrogenase major subunit